MMLDKVVPCRRMGNSSEMRLLLHNMEMVIEVKLDDEVINDHTAGRLKVLGSRG